MPPTAIPAYVSVLVTVLLLVLLPPVPAVPLVHSVAVPGVPNPAQTVLFVLFSRAQNENAGVLQSAWVLQGWVGLAAGQRRSFGFRGWHVPAVEVAFSSRQMLLMGQSPLETQVVGTPGVGDTVMIDWEKVRVVVETTGGTTTDVVMMGREVVTIGSVVAVAGGTEMVVVVRTMTVVVVAVVALVTAVEVGMTGGLGEMGGIWAEVPGATAMMAAQTARSWIENFMTGFSFVLVGEVFYDFFGFWRGECEFCSLQ